MTKYRKGNDSLLAKMVTVKNNAQKFCAQNGKIHLITPNQILKPFPP